MSNKEVIIERLTDGFKVTVKRDFSCGTFACKTLLEVHERVERALCS
jgi:hypothetical protein